MSIGLILALVGIAFVDSLNPSLFVAQLYLLTTPRPIPRVLSYIAGVIVANYLGGVLVLGGLRSLITTFFSSIDPAVFRGGELLLGLGLLVFGLLLRLKPAEVGEARKPRSLQPIHTFGLGMIVMVNELTTALPYFVAIERLAQAQLSLLGNLAGLGIYNLIFALPLFGFLLLYMQAQQHFVQTIERVNRGLAVWMPRLIKYSCIIVGAFFVFDAAAFFMAGRALIG
ncbi:MAG: GAP family protein [Roseiflexaceae bacterium]|nr:GAP family protein [Roseiflexaceae bacterium]